MYAELRLENNQNLKQINYCLSKCNCLWNNYHTAGNKNINSIIWHSSKWAVTIWKTTDMITQWIWEIFWVKFVWKSKWVLVRVLLSLFFGVLWKLCPLLSSLSVWNRSSHIPFPLLQMHYGYPQWKASYFNESSSLKQACTSFTGCHCGPL